MRFPIRTSCISSGYTCRRKGFILLITVGLLLYIGILSGPEEAKQPDIPDAWEDMDIAQSLEMCTERFNQSFQANLEVIKNYPRGIAPAYMPRIVGSRKVPDVIRQTPVFVTGVNWQYYLNVGELFRNLHTVLLQGERNRLQKIHIILYDLGLTGFQHQQIKQHCQCEVRRFPFEKFPKHVGNLNTYAFKPIVVQQVLMEYGFVWWMDASVRLTTPNLAPVFNYAINNSIFYTVTSDKRTHSSISKQTDAQTFKFLREDPCKFRPFGELWATTLLFHFDHVTKAVVQAWVNCALNRDCIAPPGTENKLHCNHRQRYDGRCHRFDQSVLGIILRRLYHDRNEYPLNSQLNSVYNINRSSRGVHNAYFKADFWTRLYCVDLRVGLRGVMRHLFGS